MVVGRLHVGKCVEVSWSGGKCRHISAEFARRNVRSPLDADGRGASRRSALGRADPSHRESNNIRATEPSNEVTYYTVAVDTFIFVSNRENV